MPARLGTAAVRGASTLLGCSPPAPSFGTFVLIRNQQRRKPRERIAAHASKSTGGIDSDLESAADQDEEEEGAGIRFPFSDES